MSKEKYYQLLYDWNNDNENTIFCNKSEVYVKDEYIVSSGQKIDKFDRRTSFYYEKGNNFEDYLDNILTWPLISEKFKMIFENLNVEGIQFFPVNIKKLNTNETITTYWILNIINFPNALDFKKSKYRELHEESGMVLGLTHPALIYKKIKGMPILRVQNDIVSIYISEMLRNEIEKENIVGVDFREIKVV